MSGHFILLLSYIEVLVGKYQEYISAKSISAIFIGPIGVLPWWTDIVQ